MCVFKIIRVRIVWMWWCSWGQGMWCWLLLNIRGWCNNINLFIIYRDYNGFYDFEFKEMYY